jgi:hypothetical protein
MFMQLSQLGSPAELADGTAFPSTVSFIVPPDRGVPMVEGTLGIIDGRPTLIRLQLTSLELTDISGTVLRSVNVTAIVKAATRRAAEMASLLTMRGPLQIMRNDPDSPFMNLFGVKEAREAGDRGELLLTRKLPPEAMLQLVANIARKNPESPRTAVAEQLHISKRTASRRIADARGRGFLTEDDDIADGEEQ